jgi:putative oxidoreductase
LDQLTATHSHPTAKHALEYVGGQVVIGTLTARYQLAVLGLLRATTGFMFFQHGLQKLGYLEGRVRVFPELTWFAMVLELFGGILILLGLLTRPVAFLLSGQMAVAYFLSHATQSFWPIVNEGERAYLFCFIFFFMVFAGPGSCSLDDWLQKKIGNRWWM